MRLLDDAVSRVIISAVRLVGYQYCSPNGWRQNVSMIPKGLKDERA